MSDVVSRDLISPFIPSQFPENYQENYPMFVNFMQTYYKWLEQPGNIINVSRNLLSYRDVDTANTQNFSDIFIPGIPASLATNPRILLKHILDLYQSKGTSNSFDIFFRAIFNKNVKIYTPSQDILKPSSGQWLQPYYLEVSNAGSNSGIELSDFIGKKITGSISGTTAYVQDYNTVTLQNKLINVLDITNLSGNFLSNEIISFDGNVVQRPSILGSLTTISISSGGQGFNVGDACNVYGTGSFATAKVASTTNQKNGKVVFDLISGGFGYTVNAVVTVSGGGGGDGATFSVGSLSNITEISVNLNLLSQVANTPLSSNAYGFVALPSANVNTIMGTALSNTIYTVGTISSLSNINPGQNYNGQVVISVVEPEIKVLSISDGKGNVWGGDAIISGVAGMGNGIITSLSIVDSGLGYVPGEYLTISSAANTNILNAYGFAVISNQGKGAGYWGDTNGQLDSQKKLTDDYYYQPFSYEIQTELSPSIYTQLVSDLLHPAGIAMFTKFSIIDYQDTQTFTNQFNITVT